MATDGGGTVTTTAADAVAAAAADPAAAALMSGALPAESDGTGLMAAQAETALSGGAELTEGANGDYEVDHFLGMVMLHSSGTGAEGVHQISFSHNADNGYQIEGGIQPEFVGKILAVGKSLSTSRIIIIEVPRISLTLG
ncbi:MAG: hypothetical protein GY862_33550 [Gammaproteobacteria bacterium]|nr:hypothetical protein [Gammaproteobacteria bacterium]